MMLGMGHILWRDLAREQQFAHPHNVKERLRVLRFSHGTVIIAGT